MLAKKLYVDTDLLEKKIADSIVSIEELVNALGISRQRVITNGQVDMQKWQKMNFVMQHISMNYV